MNPELNPQDAELAKLLERSAQSIQPSSAFTAELEDKLNNSQKPQRGEPSLAWKNILPSLGWVASLAVLALVLNWAIKNFLPIAPQPGAGHTPTQEQNATPEPFITESTFTPQGELFDRHGMQLYLAQPLPDSPAQMNLYVARPEQLATLESARALATQFGMRGQIYQTPAEFGGSATNDFLIVDGNQRLQVRSDYYITYYPDYTKWQMPVLTTAENPNADSIIADFLQSKGFNFEYKIEPSEMFGAYFVEPLTPDGFAIVHEYFRANGILFRLNETGILSAEFSMVQYDIVGAYGIISAQEAFQKVLDPNTVNGMIEGMHGSSGSVPKVWYRVRPQNQTVTIWGWIYSIPSLEGGAPLVTFDGYTATGNLADLPAFTENTFVQATGQFSTQNGVVVFVVESWTEYAGSEDGLIGALQRVGADVQLVMIDGETFLLPDVPSEVPVPMENAYVTGIQQGGTFEWKTIEQFENSEGGGGGGGGGGTGFYQLNLTGTPIPLPKPPQPVGENDAQLLVQAGDTLSSIAEAYGVTVEDLMQANGLTDSTIFIGQVLIIPGVNPKPPIGLRIEGQRGFLMVQIFKKPDGSQRVQYGLSTNENPIPYMFLEGENLQELQNYHNRPVDIWGTLDHFDQYGTPVIKVERYEIPFPDMQFQILQGTQRIVTIDGQPVTLFTTSDGIAYVQMFPGNVVDSSMIGLEGDQVLQEVLIIPSQTFGGYPVAIIFSSGLAVSPKNGQPLELTVMSDQPIVTDEPQAGFDLPYLIIEKVELVYYLPDPRYLLPGPGGEPLYIQPAWLFYGHYSNGDEFFILIQALEEQFLKPELAPYTAPG